MTTAERDVPGYLPVPSGRHRPGSDRPRSAAWPRIAAAFAVAAIIYAFVSSPSWNFKPVDDTMPPVPRPPVAAAIPADAAASRLLGVRLVRVQDGLPDGRLFTSTLPFARDVRQYVLNGAWETTWDSRDDRTAVDAEVVARKQSVSPPEFAMACDPTSSVSWPAPVVRAGYGTRERDAASFCALGLYRRTEIFVAIATSDPAVVPHVATRDRALFSAVAAAIPQPAGPAVTRYPTPDSTAAIRAGLLGAALGVPLLWLLPTLLFDRATWQRAAWLLRAVFRSRGRAAPGHDIDRAVRSRLWTNAALCAVQIGAAIWTIRLSDWLGWGPIATAAAVTGSVLLVTAIQRLAYLRRGSRPVVFGGARRVMGIAGMVLGVAITAVALAVVFAAVSFSAIGQGNSNPVYIQQRMDILIEVLALPLVLVANFPLMLFRRVAMRALRTDHSQDAAAPVLLLRSFADDKRRLRSRSSYRRSVTDRLSLRLWERFEEVVAVSLNAHGPVLAVGQPDEKLPPPLGAVRRQFTDEQWQSEVAKLMSSARIIAVTVGRSPALAWEIKRIAQFGHLSKTVFLLPPTSRAEHRRRLAILSGLLHLPWASLDPAPAGAWVLAVMVPEPGRPPVVIRARAQEDIGYDIALDLCAAMITQGIPVAVPDAPGPVSVPAPPMAIYPPGKTPRYRPLLRRRRVLTLLLGSGSALVTLFFTFLLGANPDSADSIPVASGHTPVAVAVDAAQSAVYCVFDYDILARVEFKPGSIKEIATMPGADDMAADDGRVYLASSARGTVEAYDVATSSVAWKLSGLPGVRGLLLRDGQLTLLVPGASKVRVVSAATGRTAATTRVAGAPWADALAGGRLYVSIVNRGAVVALDARTLHRDSRTQTEPDPVQLVSLGNSVWVYSALERSLVPLGVTHPVIYTRNVAPALASNGSIMAIEGIDQVTTVDRAGILRRLRLISGTAAALAVAPDGDVIAAAPSQLLDLHGQ